MGCGLGVLLPTTFEFDLQGEASKARDPSRVRKWERERRMEVALRQRREDGETGVIEAEANGYGNGWSSAIGNLGRAKASGLCFRPIFSVVAESLLTAFRAE